jgi:erythromycin esterase-like protein
MAQATIERYADVISEGVAPLVGAKEDYDPLMELIGNARLVLLGEASHGSREFYHRRAEITKRLIIEKGFTAVAVEGDWPDAYQVNRYVHAQSDDRTGQEALSGFQRFPAWMWRNTEVLGFVNWLRTYNDAMSFSRERVGFYGLDLYSLHASIDAVLHYLETIDPEAAARARRRYACFDSYGEDTQLYGHATDLGLGRSCEDDVVAQLKDLSRRADEYLRRDGFVAEDEFFYAQQNARLVKNAEHYYRTMFQGSAASWNLRDRHMADTLDALVSHFSKHGRAPKLVLWEHNSHLGDARATQMHEHGEINVGQLARERYGSDAVLVGFTTHSGSVTAASEWGGPAEHKVVRPGLPESYEALFHRVGIPNFILSCREDAEMAQVLREWRLERAMGVIYRPETERASHYFYARLGQQFDAVIHCDQTQAIEPLDRIIEEMNEKEAPETFPSGM